MTDRTSEVLAVELGTRSYDIHVGAGLLADAGRILKPLLARQRTVIVTDENVAALHLRALETALHAQGFDHDAIVLKPGEQTKSFAELESVLDRLLQAGVERADTIIAFGGGVIGDLTGFAAAILRRGIEFVQIPTTLLSQVDSSVGGKTGINAPQGKNLIGAFHQPRAVIIDVAILDTLPKRQLLAGYAEVVKYGALGDKDFFEWLEQHGHDLLAGDVTARTHAIAVSCRSKAQVVASDEREAGTRALLNLGHTFGHALEAETGYSDRLLHGEGVAIGMVLALALSAELGFAPAEDADRLAHHLKSMGLPSHIKDIPGAPLKADALISRMKQDKKVVGDKIVLILSRGLGQAFVTHDVTEDSLQSFLKRMV